MFEIQYKAEIPDLAAVLEVFPVRFYLIDQSPGLLLITEVEIAPGRTDTRFGIVPVIPAVEKAVSASGIVFPRLGVVESVLEKGGHRGIQASRQDRIRGIARILVCTDIAEHRHFLVSSELVVAAEDIVYVEFLTAGAVLPVIIEYGVGHAVRLFLLRMLHCRKAGLDLLHEGHGAVREFVHEHGGFIQGWLTLHHGFAAKSEESQHEKTAVY